MKRVVVISAFLIATLSLFSQNKKQSHNQLVCYKQIDTTKLYLEILYPDHFKAGKQYPAIVFFFGGGWLSGTREQFRPQAKYLASRGMIAILADYRVKNRNNTTPYDAVRDAKSAVRYIREHAKEFSVDPDMLAAGGGSAGGHLAACCGLIDGMNEPGDNLHVSSKPNALVLFNPVISTDFGEYGHGRLGDEYLSISPMHFVSSDDPPTIIMLGTNDQIVSVATAKAFKAKMDSAGVRCDLHLYDGQQHGFFNFNRSKKMYQATLTEADQFLTSLGYLPKMKRQK